MANRVKFAEIKVGETYFVQSRYWHKVLGTAKVIKVSRSEVDPNRGDLEAICDWSDNDGWVILDSEWDWFWDAEPTDAEQRAFTREFFGY